MRNLFCRLFLIRDSNAGVFLWNLRNFWEHFSAEHLRWLLLNFSIRIILSSFITPVKRKKINYNLQKHSPGRCIIKKVFLKILQNSQENTCVGANFDKIVDQPFYRIPSLVILLKMKYFDKCQNEMNG